MLRVLIFLSVVLSTSAYSEPANVKQENKWAVGEAKDVKTGKIKYYEVHYAKPGESVNEVLYYSPAGEIIVQKNLTPGEVSYAPGYEQIDNRDGESRKVSKQGEEISVSYQEKTKSKVKNKKLETDEPVVIDAGFDDYVRVKWDKLLSGKKSDFLYVLPSRQMLIELRIENKPLAECSSQAASGACFKITTPNWVIRWFVKPLWLVYDEKDKRLLSFKGTSNLNDNDGSGQSVEISYRYFQ